MADGSQLAVVILAAGQGKRMKSELPKVLHRLAGRPMIQFVLDAAGTLRPARLVVVVGHQGDQVRAALDGQDILFAEQTEQLGTGHAVLQARQAAGECGAVMVLYGDMPLLRLATLRSLWQRYRLGASPLAMLVVVDDTSRGFGRIIRDAQGRVQAIVEEAECAPEQLAIRELNPGVYCFNAAWLWPQLAQLPLHRGKGDKGEYFLTDLVAVAAEQGHAVVDLVSHDPSEALGINSPEHLAEAEILLHRRSAGAG
jgi:bifunctional UDP-N-acetylglucosamine pyrophosphorylase/glucosamine-1-phosphate N-acetyltransferase